MNDEIKKIILEAITKLINESASDKNVIKFRKIHKDKIHFVPVKYRVFGGILQSLNIKFGNFIEELMHLIIKNENHLEILDEYSGKRIGNEVYCDNKTSSIIDKYIDSQQEGNNNLKVDENFALLIDEIYKNKNNDDLLKVKHDIDILFKDKRDGKIYYLEAKYNDDHDTGKFVDLNRKMIKTYSGLVKTLKIDKKEDFIPILFYMNEKVRYTNSFIPQTTNIIRGRDLFNKFFTIKFEDLDQYLKNIGEDRDVIKLFDDLLNKI
ncbi:MAG: restriction endonuclease [Candidatus Gracilibacteria bacterium]|nr:restriction endonuclease [Candidatus Gracilibacteria bacterium]